jgi:ankyrin repeat protein
MQLFALKSVDRMAAQFDLVIPPTFAGENVLRSSILNGQSLPDIQAEMLKVLLYLLSNHLIGDRKTLLSCGSEVLNYCHLSGLSNPSVLAEIVNLSLQSPTLAAVIDTIFSLAVNLVDVDWVSTLLRVDKRIHPDRLVRIYDIYSDDLCLMRGIELTTLSAGIVRNSFNMAKIAIEAGADLNLEVSQDLCTLTFAILQRNYGSCESICRLMVDKGAKPNMITGLSPLQAAISLGDFPLVKQLLVMGADAAYRCRNLNYHFIPVPDLPQEYFRHITYGSLDCAAGYPGIYFTRQSSADLSKQGNGKSHEEIALELCKLLYSHNSHPCNDEIENGVIWAAARGYDRVVSFFLDELSANVNATNGVMSPIYAAVAFGGLKMCERLIRYGASLGTADLKWELYPFSPSTMSCPSLIHIAVYNNSADILELLFHNGADAEQSFKGWFRFGNQTLWPPCDWNQNTTEFTGCPLKLAVQIKNWNMAYLLVNLGVSTLGIDVTNVIFSGQFELLQLLLENGAHAEPKRIQGQGSYQAVFEDQAPVAVYLASKGLMAIAKDFGSAFQMPDVDSIRKLVPSRLLDNIQSISPDIEGGSYLENAILTGKMEVISFALSLDQNGYDSGALCAAVYVATYGMLSDGDSRTVLAELIQRRDALPTSSGLNLCLENTAISIAAKHGKLHLMQLLLRSHPRVAVEHSQAIAPWTHFTPGLTVTKKPTILLYQCSCKLEYSENISYWHANTRITASPLASIFPNTDNKILEYLLDVGYRVDSATFEMAAEAKSSPQVVKRLIEQWNAFGAGSADKKPLYPNYFLWTPLLTTASLGFIDMVETLLENGADVNTVYYRDGTMGLPGFTLLSQAIECRDFQLIDCLLRNGANVNTLWHRERWSDPPIIKAAESGCLGLLQRLIRLGADPMARRCFFGGLTTLEAAAGEGRLDTVQHLLNLGAKTENQSRFQYVRATFRASQNGHTAVVMILRSWRQWIDDDDVFWDMLVENDFNSFFFIPYEQPLAEVITELARTPCNTWMETCPSSFHYAPDQVVQVALTIKFWADKAGSLNTHMSDVELLEDAANVALTSMRRRQQVEHLRVVEKLYGRDSTTFHATKTSYQEELQNWNTAKMMNWFARFPNRKVCEEAQLQYIARKSFREWVAQFVGIRRRSEPGWDCPSQFEVSHDSGTCSGSSLKFDTSMVIDDMIYGNNDMACGLDSNTSGGQDMQISDYTSELSSNEYNVLGLASLKSSAKTVNTSGNSVKCDVREDTEEKARMKAIRADLNGMMEAAFLPMDCGV